MTTKQRNIPELDGNSSEPAPRPAGPSYKPGDRVLVNSIEGVITSWPDVERPDQWFHFEVRDVHNNSVDRHTEQLGTVTITRVPTLGE